MANKRNPGPLGVAADLSLVDSILDRGTLCIAHGSPPGPLSRPSQASSQPLTQARIRLAAVTWRFASRFIRDTQLRTAYLAECKRCIQSLPTLFQQDQPDEREVRNLTDGSSNKIISMQGLIGVGTVPTFHKLVTGLRGYGGAGIQPLLHTDFTQQGDAEKQATCLKLFNNLAPKHSELRGSNGLHKAERWLRFMTACLVWTLDAGRMAGTLSWQPELNQARITRPIEPMVRLSRLEYDCIYSRRLTARMQAAAPHVIHLSPTAGFTRELIETGWGRKIVVEASEPDKLLSYTPRTGGVGTHPYQLSQHEHI